MGFVVPTVIAGFADCLRLWHILVQQTEVRAPRRPVVAARLLDAVSSWQTCKRWLTIRAGYKGPLGFHNHGEGTTKAMSTYPLLCLYTYLAECLKKILQYEITSSR